MTSREIVFRNLEHKDPPRPAFAYSGERCNDFASAGVAPPENWGQKRWIEGNVEYYNDEWGNLWHRFVGGSVKGEILQPVLQDWEDLETLECPDYDNPALYERAKTVFAASDDRFRLLSIGGWVFDNARYLRKLEVYLMDLIEHPDKVRRLNDKVAAAYEAKIYWAGRCGADGIFIGEDWGTQTGPLIGPEMWRSVFKSTYKRLLDQAHSYGLKVFMHSCGYNWQLLDDLIDVGIDCFQFDQPAAYDLPALAAKFRERGVSLFAPVDIQKILPTGDRHLIETEARRMVDLFRGMLIVKDYPDLPGIGVDPEWDDWAYRAFLEGF